MPPDVRGPVGARDGAFGHVQAAQRRHGEEDVPGGQRRVREVYHERLRLSASVCGVRACACGGGLRLENGWLDEERGEKGIRNFFVFEGEWISLSFF